MSGTALIVDGVEPDARVDEVRVMHLVHTFGVGGMEVGVTKLVNALDGSRVASSICSCCPGDSLKLRLNAGVELFELKRRKGNDPALVGRIYRLLRREQPHVLHTHRWATLCEGLIAARLAGVPFVVHGEHGTLETRRHNVWVQRWVWNHLDLVLSVSSRLAERMASEVGFPIERIKTIRNGVDLYRFRSGDRLSARRIVGLPEQGLLIGTVGRLVPVKDQVTLLDSLANLRDRGLMFQAAIAGTGPLRDELTAYAASLRLDETVHFLGNRNDVDEVLRSFDVFVLSSRSEGLSNTILEAMATGLPVVATRVGGTDELVQENETGLMVPPGNPTALADAVHILALDPNARKAMGAAGRARAEAHFGLDRMIREYERMYLDLVRRQPGLLRQAEAREA